MDYVVCSFICIYAMNTLHNVLFSMMCKSCSRGNRPTHPSTHYSQIATNDIRIYPEFMNIMNNVIMSFLEPMFFPCSRRRNDFACPGESV